MRFKPSFPNFFAVFQTFFLVLFCQNGQLFAQTLMAAPGAPGKDAQWASAGKQGIGTAVNLESKIWFTLQGGALTEVYYPDVTMANVHKLELIIVHLQTGTIETEMRDTISEIVSDKTSLSFTQINTAKSGEYKITKKYTVDPENNSVLIKIYFEGHFKRRENDYQLFVYYDPSLKNSGMHDTAWTQDNALLSQDDDVASALIVNRSSYEIESKKHTKNFSSKSNGYLGVSDGLTQLLSNKTVFPARMTEYEKAENGNVVQVAELAIPAIEKDLCCQPYTLVLGFGKTADEALKTAQKSLGKGFDRCEAEYKKGWSDYVKTLPKVDPKYQAQFNMAAMVLRAHEDKTQRGANIASLTVPWGGGANANEANVGGYHLVWSRDLYQVATAYMALGDKPAAIRALDFLFKVQQKPDGSFPQNSYLDGKSFSSSTQLDEVAYPLILAYQLGRDDRETWINHVKKAADFIVRTGPKTAQERWEEKSGYSPSTIAAEIAGLVCAAEIAKKNQDESSALTYLATADDWARNVERWTATTRGVYGDGNYYLRLTENGTPDANEKTVLNNNAGAFFEKEIVDAGFLELVRLGIKSPDDLLIQKSLKVVDEVLKVKTPNGEAFYRYNHDGYGEMDDGRRWNWDGKYTGKGRLWALLSGERGQYEISNCGLEFEKSMIHNPRPRFLKCVDEAKTRLDAMLGFANDGLMIPEQVWDKAETPPNVDKQFVPELKFGEGTGSATPLAWSMAQFIRLAVNLQTGRNLETPDIVYHRYVRKTVDENQIKTATQSPIVENEKATFIFRGDAKQVEIASDFTDWQPHHLTFQLIPGTNTQFLTLPFDNTARVEYKLIVDGKWMLDPLNQNKIDNGVGGENSFFAMPNYKPTVWDRGAQPALENFDLNTKKFGARSIKVYLPPAYAASKQAFPVLYVQDGTEYFNKTRAAVQQENLVKAGKIQPFIIVLIDPQERMKEYWANDDWADLMANEIVPAIDARYRTMKTPDGRALLGASLGGVTSVWTALKHPEIFARVGGQSSSFWIDDERPIKALAELDPQKSAFRFYFDSGTMEDVERSRRAVKILRDKNFSVRYEEAATGHNWISWRDRLADAYLALWK